MKLRLRSVADPRQTLRLDLPPAASLSDLRCAIFAAISSSSAACSSAGAESVRLSLNRKDELVADDPAASLRSLGITSGDLVFFTLDAAAFPSSSSSSSSAAATASATQIPAELLAQISSDVGAKGIPVRDVSGHGIDLDGNRDSPLDWSAEAGYGETLTPAAPIEGEGGKPEDMDVDYEVVGVGKYSALPCVLQKVLKEEADNVRGSDVRLMVVSVHAVFLEYGFVGFDSLSGKAMVGYGLHPGWAGLLTTNLLKLRYSLPCLVHSECNLVETVDLRFQILGKYVNVYGSVAGKGLNSFHLLLDASRYALAIGFLWENLDTVGSGKSETSHEKQVFGLWKVIKDMLLLPLHMDLSEKARLPSPPCFMRMPTDLKIHILDRLSGVDLAKMACVCSEMNYLSSNDDLWRQRYTEAFGEVEIVGVRKTLWKDKFAVSWVMQKKMEREFTRRARRRNFYYFMRRPDHFGGSLFIIGGDHDMIPNGRHLARDLFHPRRFSAHGNSSGSQFMF